MGLLLLDSTSASLNIGFLETTVNASRLRSKTVLLFINLVWKLILVCYSRLCSKKQNMLYFPRVLDRGREQGLIMGLLLLDSARRPWRIVVASLLLFCSAHAARKPCCCL